MARTDNRPHCSLPHPCSRGSSPQRSLEASPIEGFAEVEPFSANFKARDMAVTGGTLHIRVGGSGPAVLLLHGFGDTGECGRRS